MIRDCWGSGISTGTRVSSRFGRREDWDQGRYIAQVLCIKQSCLFPPSFDVIFSNQSALLRSVPRVPITHASASRVHGSFASQTHPGVFPQSTSFI